MILAVAVFVTDPGVCGHVDVCMCVNTCVIVHVWLYMHGFIAVCCTVYIAVK